jgi:hypothetical protein
LVFSLVPRCHGECGSQKYTSIPVETEKSACRAISFPWSQVTDLRMNSGRVSIFIASSFATRSALRSYGIRTNMVNLVVRSTRVAICDAFALPMIKSPSQNPGTARSAASAGRSLTFTMPRIFPLLHDTRDLLTRLARPCRNANVSSVRNTPRACKYNDW